MKKNYSDPMMFASSFVLTSYPIKPSDEGTDPPDTPWSRGSKSAVFINSAIEAPVADKEPVKIVNPVEEAVEEAATGYSTESAAEAASTSTLEVAPVIDEIVPEVAEETATGETTMP